MNIPTISKFTNNENLNRIANFYRRINSSGMAPVLEEDSFVSSIKKVPNQNRYTEKILESISIFYSSYLAINFNKAAEQVKRIFSKTEGVQSFKSRFKSPSSIFFKMLSGIKNSKKPFSVEDAIGLIGDGLGTRVLTKSLEPLSENRIKQMIADMKIDNKILTQKQQELLMDFINEKHLSKPDYEEGFKLFEKFAEPLIEKKTEGIVNQLILGVLKSRILGGEITLEQLKKSKLFDAKLLKRLENENITPIKITEINNYRGLHGLPEFSDNQIRKLTRATLFNSKNQKIDIISSAKGLDYCRYNRDKLQSVAKSAIKPSGYRTAQVNVIHENGIAGEIQFRGIETNKFANCEHLVYDIKKGKITLGHDFSGFEKSLKALSPDDYKKYNSYLEAYYNYFNRIELGLPAKKPVLPYGFSKNLSVETLKNVSRQIEDVNKKIFS